MAKKQKIEPFRRARAKDLRCFADAVDKHIGGSISNQIHLCVNQLNNMDTIQSYRDSDCKNVYDKQNIWGYSVEDIEIDILADRHLKPKGLINAKAIVSVTVAANFNSWSNLVDPFYEMSFNVTIRGNNPTKANINYFGFHIDRHHESQVSDEIHPIYHLQYNLNPLKKDEFDYGDALYMDAPRFLHYPVELILGLTFLIGNFQPDNYKKLIEDRTVKKIIQDYQENIWKPYSFTMASHWGNNISDIEWDKNIICPFYL